MKVEAFLHVNPDGSMFLSPTAEGARSINLTEVKVAPPAGFKWVNSNGSTKRSSIGFFFTVENGVVTDIESSHKPAKLAGGWTLPEFGGSAPKTGAVDDLSI